MLRARTELSGLALLALQALSVPVFYVERAGSIEIWRVLHGKRDIPRWLQDGTEPSSE